MKKEVLYKTLKVISNILLVILGIILLIVLYAFINLKILNHKYVSIFSYTVFQIASNSMAPEITTNDLILVKVTKDVSENDIITYDDGESLVTHRLISKNGNTYITKGDANNDADGSIAETQIIGKVIKILPNFGVWYKVITTPKIIALICITLFLFSLAFSYTCKKKLSKDDDFGIYYSGILLKKDEKKWLIRKNL